MSDELPERRPCPVKQRPKVGEVQLPYAESKVDGRMRHISEVPSGLACECRCPACSADLVARKGRQQAHNFAHRSNQACTRAYETAIHRLAKQVIAEAGKVGLPEVKAVVGDEERHLFPQQVFELDSVTLEKWLPGMRPDIVAQRGERKLLIEIAVTHFCDEKKRELIRKRADSAIEIDLRGVPRDAEKALIEAAILSTADREWLYNKRRDDVEAIMAAEQELKAAEKQARQEAAARAMASRVLKAWRATPVQANAEAAVQMVASWNRDVRDGQLERHLHLDVGGEAAFLSGNGWLALLVGRFVAQTRWCKRRYTTVTVLDTLREAGQLKEGLDGFISKDVADFVRQTDPAFLSPYEAVEAALTRLYERGVVKKHGGSWSTDYSVAYAAEQAIGHAREGRAQIGEVRKALGELIVLAGIKIDVRLWLTTRHGNWSASPATLAAAGQRPADNIIRHLGRLRYRVGRQVGTKGRRVF
ncbi:hypothetical protein, partial [Caenispirillum bisanense]|uniref:hypothetical protein n=1 Tax=Caenispirillum bisanense TaxID=414052 RepID=UPI0031DC9E62